MISWSVIALLGDLSTLLITKFGVAFGISNLISLGLGICTRITSQNLKKCVLRDLGKFYYELKTKKRKKKQGQEKVKRSLKRKEKQRKTKQKEEKKINMMIN
jgi:hypothetical protein